jgi:glucokinase
MPVSSAPESGYCIGIDIGGTKCAVIAGNRNGEVVMRLERATVDGLATWPDAGETLAVMVESVCKQLEIAPTILYSIGISCGGPLDSKTGTILNPPNLPGWVNVSLQAFFSGRFGVRRVYIENDANATALAEHRWGAGIGCDNLAYLTCGTGIGAGIILGGQLYRGKGDLAGEIGHAVIIPDGPLCLCGKRGCLEALASGSSIGRIASQELGIPGLTGKDVFNLVKTGNELAATVVSKAAFHLGIGIANLLQTLNLDRVIIGSLASYAGEKYLDEVREAVRANTWKSIFEGTKIIPSGLGKGTQDLAALAVALPIED